MPTTTIIQPEQVPDIRRRYREANGALKPEVLAAEFGVTRGHMVRVLNGAKFGRDGACNVLKEPPKSRRFTPEQVVAMRASYPRPRVTLESLGKRYRCSVEGMRNILLGIHYSEVPGALDSLKKRRHPSKAPKKCTVASRRYLPEVVLFMRLQYHPDTCSTTKLAHHYGTTQPHMHLMVTGKAYLEVPKVARSMGHSGPKRAFTDAQVIDARYRFHAGLATSHALAAELGATQSATHNMLIHKTYRHIPPALKDHESKRRRLSWKHNRGKKIVARTLIKVRVERDPFREEPHAQREAA